MSDFWEVFDERNVPQLTSSGLSGKVHMDKYLMNTRKEKKNSQFSLYGKVILIEYYKYLCWFSNI